MENASKALLMAGGVLIAMAIIGLAVATYSHATDLARENEYALSTSQIESFNRFYTAYIKTYSGINKISCVDAVNILNRAVEDGITPVNRSTVITKSADGYYQADSVNYLTKTMTYELEYNKALRIVEKVIIADVT